MMIVRMIGLKLEGANGPFDNMLQNKAQLYLIEANGEVLKSILPSIVLIGLIINMSCDGPVVK